MNQSIYNLTHVDERMKIYQLLSQHRVVSGNGVPDYEMGILLFSILYGETKPYARDHYLPQQNVTKMFLFSFLQKRIK